MGLRDYKNQLILELGEQDITLVDNQIDLLIFFGELLLDENTRQNLTRIADPKSVITRHIVDSLIVTKWLDDSASGRLIDLGSGGGVPGIPLAIAMPHLTINLIDSEAKKVGFLNWAASELGLRNTSAHHLRAEEAGQDPSWRESGDLVVARSVANLPVLLELALPLVKPGGSFWAYKGLSATEEVNVGEKASIVLGGRIIKTHNYTLSSGEQHNLVEVHKVSPTPSKYPRRPGMPNKRPLS